MRVQSIELSWFRGAAEPVALELDGKSMVVYGANGAGKSSFVDAVEYVLKNGRIEHLAHEYSGKRQENAIPNTHAPEGARIGLGIKLQDGSEVKVAIRQDGTKATSGDGIEIERWDYLRTVLRQGEVATFIMGTKGEKYSALLPLLGLASLETAAENLRQIAKTVEDTSGLRAARGELQSAQQQREAFFGQSSDSEILAAIADLHHQYCGDGPATDDPLVRCDQLARELDKRLGESSADERRYVALRDVAALNLKDCIEGVRATSSKLASSVEPLVAEQLAVLESAGLFADKLSSEEQVACPACGRLISVDVFQSHLEEERIRLRETADTYHAHRTAVVDLCNTVGSLKGYLDKADLESWRRELLRTSSAAGFSCLDGTDPESLRSACGEENLVALHRDVCPLIDAASAATAGAPPTAQKLSTDRQTTLIGASVLEGIDRARTLERVEALLTFIRSLEVAVREELRLRSQSVVEEISVDVRTMWGLLHPDEPIEKVRLYIPEDADKAIDIGLTFYGVQQDSPRLTLSEGHRNSLGLCIFLAMAKRESETDRPIFLDDVVISVDRGHRGMIVELLQKVFSERQVVVLTHDRDWYSELRYQLDGSNWRFRTLQPYETPSQGIRWSDSGTSFGDARAQLPTRPDSAGNDARKIMDTELALVAEHLRTRMPFLRAERNDKRTAHEFLARLIGDGSKCLQEKQGNRYVECGDAIASLQEADRLLLSWGNRASHTFDIVRPEAQKLIDACEKALECFVCKSCGRRVWFADAAGLESVQCQCGQLRWRYGKG